MTQADIWYNHSFRVFIGEGQSDFATIWRPSPKPQQPCQNSDQSRPTAKDHGKAEENRIVNSHHSVIWMLAENTATLITSTSELFIPATTFLEYLLSLSILRLSKSLLCTSTACNKQWAAIAIPPAKRDDEMRRMQQPDRLLHLRPPTPI